MTTVGCTSENSLGEESDGEVFRLDEINRDGVVHMEEEACDNLCGGEMSESFCCDEQCAYECAKVNVLSSAIEEPSAATSDLCNEDRRDATEECYRCEAIYKSNEELLRERCGGIFEDVCEQASLEEEVVEELIFFSDDENEANEVSGDALDGSRT